MDINNILYYLFITYHIRCGKKHTSLAQVLCWLIFQSLLQEWRGLFKENTVLLFNVSKVFLL